MGLLAGIVMLVLNPDYIEAGIFAHKYLGNGVSEESGRCQCMIADDKSDSALLQR